MGALKSRLTITQVTNSFEKLVKGIDKLIFHQVKISFNMVVSQFNFPYIFDTASFIYERFGVKNFHATRVGKPVNAKENFDQYLLTKYQVNSLRDELIKIKKILHMIVGSSLPYPICSFDNEETFNTLAFDKKCTAGKTSYAICTNGDVKACPRESETYGNLIKDNFVDIWSEMVKWRDGSLIPVECKNCNSFNICLSGCRIDAFMNGNSLSTTDPYIDINNSPIKFQKNKSENEDLKILPNEKFTLKNSVNFLKEEFGYRMSQPRKYQYISSEFYNFLEKHKEFDMDLLCDYFKIDIPLAQKIIIRLQNSDFLESLL